MLFRSDYEIKEAIASGIRDGRLSWYRGYEILRLGNEEAVAKGEMACAKYSRFGRSRYDFLLFAKILAGVIRAEVSVLIKEHRFRRLRCAEIPYARDDEFVCTETAYEISYLQGDPIVSPDVICLPPAVQEAVDSGRLVSVQELDNEM